MNKAYLSLGSNIGDKKNNLHSAIKLLKENENIKVNIISSLYETEPVGFVEQDKFYNIVVEISTSLNPYKLLEYLNEIEEKLFRERIIRWGPRTIDIDILLYDNFISDDEKLTIPHPRMKERAFVMIPLYEVSKDVLINNKKIEFLMQELDNSGIKRINYNMES